MLSTRAEVTTLVCQILALLIELAWETPERAQACDLADELLELLID